MDNKYRRGMPPPLSAAPARQPTRKKYEAKRGSVYPRTDLIQSLNERRGGSSLVDILMSRCPVRLWTTSHTDVFPLVSNASYYGSNEVTMEICH
jgi:hypothetical protein